MPKPELLCEGLWEKGVWLYIFKVYVVRLVSSRVEKEEWPVSI